MKYEYQESKDGYQIEISLKVHKIYFKIQAPDREVLHSAIPNTTMSLAALCDLAIREYNEVII